MTEAIIAPKAREWMVSHIERYLATDGADGHMIIPPGQTKLVPTLLLTTTGRRSGQKLMMPLIYGTVDGNVVVIASRGGAPEHPNWYLNLVADPEVAVQILGDRFRAKARTATGDERRRLWDEMLVVCPFYADYQAATTREIPVVVLERLPD